MVEGPKRPVISSTADLGAPVGAVGGVGAGVEIEEEPKISARRSWVTVEAGAVEAEEGVEGEAGSSPMRSRSDD